jgi:hypothetical protein
VNWVVVLNICDVLCSNARESQQSAAQRWGCGYAELTERFSDLDPSWDKYGNIVRFAYSHDVDRMLYLDADTLVRSDAPNPFELFTDLNALYAVLDFRPEYDAVITEEWHRVITSWPLGIVHGWFNWPGIVTGRNEEWFFNAGFFLFQPAAFKMELEQFLAHIPSVQTVSLVEQGMWNYLVKRRTVLIDRTWNRLLPDVSGPMKDYVYHFTGFGKERVRPQLPTYNWKI